MHQLTRLLAIFFTVYAGAQAQPASSQVKSAAFIENIAIRGLECGLLLPWQATSLHALVQRDMAGWEAEKRAALTAEVNKLRDKTNCDNEAMKVWIDGSSRGFDGEMLSPYLVAYRTLAQMEEPPQAFSAVALRSDFAPAIDAINGKLAVMQANGVATDGGKPWPEFIQRTETAIRSMAGILSADETNGPEADNAAAMFAQTALIVEQWLAVQE